MGRAGANRLESLFVGISLLSLYGTKWILILGLTLILIDTGGLHWFLAAMVSQVYHAVFRQKRMSGNPIDQDDSSPAD